MSRWTKSTMVAIAALCLGFASWRWMFGYRFTEVDIKRLIDANIPIGSTKDQVVSFLLSQGWQRSGYEKTPEDLRTDRDNPLYGSHAFIGAGAGNNIGPGFIHLGHIGVMFLFDENNRLIKYTTRQYYEFL